MLSWYWRRFSEDPVYRNPSACVVETELRQLIPAGDVTRLAEYLTMLIHDREKLLELSLKARETFDRHATWADTAASIYHFLQDFLLNFR